MALTESGMLVKIFVLLACILTFVAVTDTIERRGNEIRRKSSHAQIKSPILKSTHTKSTQEQDGLLKLRKRISRKMADYEFFRQNTTLKDLVAEDGGRPEIVVIMTTFRSGSSFLTSILRSHPGTFAVFEPLANIIHPICTKELEQKSLRILDSALDCNYTYLNSESHKIRASFILEAKIRNNLGSLARKATPELLSSICRHYPFRVLKNVRLALKFAKHFLEHPRHNTRVIYLVRDPRGIMHSRLQPEMKFNLRTSGNDVISSAHHLCTQMQRDFHVATELGQLYPERILRYEDLCRDVHEVTMEVFNFINWKCTASVESFLQTHTIYNDDQPMSVFRNTTERPSRWRNTWNASSAELVDIEQKCGTAIRLWSYEMLTNVSPIQLLPQDFKFHSEMTN